MKFGCNYSFWQNSWAFSPEQYRSMAHRLSAVGFDVMEISADHLYHMSEGDIASLRDEGAKLGMEFSTNSGPAREYDLASPDEGVRRNGIAYFKKIMENMNKLPPSCSSTSTPRWSAVSGRTPPPRSL